MSLNTTVERIHTAAAALACVLLLAAGGHGTVGAQEPGDAADELSLRTPVEDDLLTGLRYRMVGPARGGRVTTVAGHPAHPHTFYMGSTGGGIWKTTNHGQTWRNVSDGELATASMGAIRVAPSDTSVLYAGTGSDGIRSNVITGRGIYRSSDAGETWDFRGLREAGQIGAVEVHPEDPDLVYAAALGHPFGKNPERGVFRSRDGGESWEKVLFANDSVGAVDLELHPTDPSIVYAAMWRGEREPWTIISGAGPGSGDGIWKSTDGGDTWRRVTDGLPQGLIGKIDFAVSAADPDRAYALVEAPPEEEGLYRSDDAGETWRLVNEDQEGRLMHRPFYFTNVDADPTDADVVYVGNLLFYRSEDGGESFEVVRTPHADNHDLWINPEDPRIMVQGNDGGANVTLDGGETWSTQHNQPTAELYQVDVDDRFPYWLYAGQQDNSTIAVPSLPPAEPSPIGPEGWWKAVGGCETGPAVPRPGSEPVVVYANCKGRFGRFDMGTGQEKGYWVGAVYMYGRNPSELPYRFQRTVPIEVSPHDPDVVYHGSQYVHRTTNGGMNWERISPDLTAFPEERQVASGTPITRDITGEEHYSTLYVIEESPHRAGTVWAGANDGPVHVTTDGGESWRNVTPPEWPAEGRINAIEVSPHRPEKVYVTGYRYLLDDWAPYVFRTTDGGESWTRIADGTRGIPAETPVRVVREDPEREGLLYAGTEFGMYLSFDDGATWQPFQRNLPTTPITDIELHRGDLVLSTMGRSFWIMDDPAPLRQLSDRVASADAHLFRPSPAVRMRYRGTGMEPRNPATPAYPDPGANIDYWLAEEAPGLRLEILDPGGEVVRTFRGAPPDTATADEGEGPDGMDRADASRTEPGVLPTGPGAHRFRWNLRHRGPWSASDDRDGGPVAVPGRYTVRLTVGDRSLERPLEVLIDPRVEADGVSVADLQEQLELNLRIRDAISDGRRAAATVDSLRETVAAADSAGRLPENRAAALESSLAGVDSALVTREDGVSYPPPMLIDQLEYLYGMTTDADQKPGADAHERYRELRRELDGLQEELERVRARMPSS